MNQSIPPLAPRTWPDVAVRLVAVLDKLVDKTPVLGVIAFMGVMGIKGQVGVIEGVLGFAVAMLGHSRPVMAGEGGSPVSSVLGTAAKILPMVAVVAAVGAQSCASNTPTVTETVRASTYGAELDACILNGKQNGLSRTQVDACRNSVECKYATQYCGKEGGAP